jgi:hypothetical protein
MERKKTKETRQLSRVNGQTASHLHGMDRVGWASIALRCWKPLEKENHLDCSLEPLYTIHISGRSFVYGFYPIAVQKIIIEMLKNLNDPRFKRIAKPSSSPLATGAYEYTVHLVRLLACATQSPVKV